MARDPTRWDIVCRVVDNYGDAGVAFRLARMLAIEHGERVTLWIDDPVPLAAQLEPLAATLEQHGLEDLVIVDTIEFARRRYAAAARGVLSPYVAAQRERENAADEPVSAVW